MKEKQSLQSVTPYKVMNIKECLDALGWNYEEDGERYNNISCPCGGKLEFSGFIGTEVVECAKCKKSMVDLFSPIRTGNSTATILDSSKYEFEGDRHWIAMDDNGGVMAEEVVEND